MKNVILYDRDEGTGWRRWFLTFACLTTLLTLSKRTSDFRSTSSPVIPLIKQSWVSSALLRIIRDSKTATSIIWQSEQRQFRVQALFLLHCLEWMKTSYRRSELVVFIVLLFLLSRCPWVLVLLLLSFSILIFFIRVWWEAEVCLLFKLTIL